MNPDGHRFATRRVGWEACFEAALLRAQGRHFEFGRFDCCLFAADIVNSITGVDMAMDLRGKYKTKKGALHIINETFGGIEHMTNSLCALYGLVKTPPAMAQRGDVMLIPSDADWGGTLGICLGSTIVAPTAPKGLASCPVTAATRAWHIIHSAKCPN